MCPCLTTILNIRRWEFKSDYYDVGFYVTFEDEEKEIVDYSRADSHVVLQKGALECHKPGKCKLNVALFLKYALTHVTFFQITWSSTIHSADFVQKVFTIALC